MPAMKNFKHSQVSNNQNFVEVAKKA